MFVEPYKMGNGHIEIDGKSYYYGSADKKGSCKSIINILLILTVLNKFKISSFKCKQDQCIKERYQSIDQAHFTVFHGSPEFQCQIWGKQIIKETCEDGACSVPDGLTR